METTITIRKVYRTEGKKKNGDSYILTKLLGTDGKYYTTFSPTMLSGAKDNMMATLEFEPSEVAGRNTIKKVISILSQPNKPLEAQKQANNANPMSNLQGEGKEEASTWSSLPPIPLSDASPKDLYLKAIDIVVEASKAKGVPTSFTDIGNVFNAEIEAKRQQFEANHSIFIARSQELDRKRAKENMKT